MHPTVLLFVLLFIPNSSLPDWQNAPAPNLHLLMQKGALGLMNSRTAEVDRITADAEERTIYAGARMGPTSAEDSPNYLSLANNLPDALTSANVTIQGMSDIPELNIPFYNPPPSAQFTVVHLTGTWDQIDQQIGVYSNFVTGKRALLMVTSPVPSESDYDSLRQLTPVLLWGEGVSPGYLVSASTRTPGLIANTDIAPSVASFLGATLPVQPYGSTVAVFPTSEDLASSLMARENSWIAQAYALRILPYLAGMVALLVLLAVYLNGTSRSSAIRIAAFAVIIPLTILLSSNFLIFAGFLGLAIVAAAFVLKPSDTVIFTAATIAIMVLVDAFLFGGKLTGQSILGYSPIEGARYYGIGNEVMGAYIGALVVITGIWDWRGKNLPQLVALWLVAAVSLALPTAGAKAGGLIVCLTTLATYVCVSKGRKLSDPLTLASIAAAFVVSLLSLLLLTRFGPQTHISEALAMEKTGGIGTFFQTIVRKSEMDVHLVFHSAWIWVLLTTSYGRWRLHRSDVLASVGTVATVSCLLFNDAGVIAAAICGLIVWAAEFNRIESRSSSSRKVPVGARVV